MIIPSLLILLCGALIGTGITLAVVNHRVDRAHLAGYKAAQKFHTGARR